MRNNISLLLCLLTTAVIAVPGYLSGSNFGQGEFIRNRGQVHDQYGNPRSDLQYYANDGDLVWHLKSDGFSYQQYAVQEWSVREDPLDGSERLEPIQMQVHRVDMQWMGANPTAPMGVQKLPGALNFYHDGMPQGITGVETFQSVRQVGLYSGIDVMWKWDDGHLKYEYLVSPGSDFKDIRIKITGHDQLLVDQAGQLVVMTPLGTITEGAPLVMQNGSQLPARWMVDGDVISFGIEGVDPHTALLIDPAVRSWGSYYGGSATDYFRDIAVDNAGNVYAGGQTFSNAPALFATVGAHQTLWGGGSSDAIIVKMNGSGVRQWATLYGGANQEEVLGCAVDASGNSYYAGVTTSTSGTAIASPGAFQTTTTGSGNEAFLVKLDPSGVRLWGTYYGSGDDVGYGCAVDATGNVFLVGNTTGTSNIATGGSHQPALAGNKDVFVAKFDGAGARLWGTYYGSTKLDRPYACTTDPLGAIIVAGVTDTLAVPSGIASPGAHQTTAGGGDNDAFVVKFDASGLREWGTYYGGEQEEEFRGISTDASGNIFAAGHTYSYSGISTAGSFQATLVGMRDAMLVKFTPAGVREWGTYFGGTNSEFVTGADCDLAGNVAFMGHTMSTSGIATAGAHQATWIGEDDIFVTHFDGDGNQLWGTYYGADKGDWAESCVFDPSGDLFISGFTYSTMGIATSGGHQPAFGGGFSDGFIAKFDVILASVDLADKEHDGLLLYPNPSDGISHLRIKDWDGKPYDVEVLNLHGVVVHSLRSSCGELSLHPMEISQGTYIVKVRTEGGVKAIKWIVTK